MKSITIVGKRWFDKINGNTYFSAIGLIDGEPKVNIDYEYGYGEHYKERIFDELEKAGFIKDREKNECFWRYCDRNGIKDFSHVSDVGRKKDL